MDRNKSITYMFLAVFAACAASTGALAQPGGGKEAAAMGAQAGQGRHGMGRGGKHRYGAYWKSTLTDEQRAEVAKLRAAHKKRKMPLKARARALKVELAVLATTDDPDSGAIDKKIDEVLRLKREMMREKARHIAAVRKVLTDEQRAYFDVRVLKKATHGKRMRHGGGHHGGHGH